MFLRSEAGSPSALDKSSGLQKHSRELVCKSFLREAKIHLPSLKNLFIYLFFHYVAQMVKRLSWKCLCSFAGYVVNVSRVILNVFQNDLGSKVHF